MDVKWILNEFFLCIGIVKKNSHELIDLIKMSSFFLLFEPFYVIYPPFQEAPSGNPAN
jgi:hypothetical protein